MGGVGHVGARGVVETEAGKANGRRKRRASEGGGPRRRGPAREAFRGVTAPSMKRHTTLAALPAAFAAFVRFSKHRPSMQMLAPMVRAWSHRLAGRPLRARMRLLPIGAAVALAAIFLVSVSLGVLDPRSLTKIQRDYYPALRAGQDMRETLNDLQNAIQGAAATQDADRLAEMDSLSTAFLAAAAEARSHAAEGGHAEVLAQRFRDFYGTVRPLSQALAAGANADSLQAGMTRATSDYATLRRAIEDDIVMQETAIEDAFRTARVLQVSATFGVAFIALLAVLALGALSVATTQAVIEPLEEMARVAGRVAQ